MAKIFSILTLLIAGAAAFLGFQSQQLVKDLQKAGETRKQQLDTMTANYTKTKAELETMTKDRDNEKGLKEKALADLAATKADLDKANADLAGVKMQLDAANANLAKIQDSIKTAFAGTEIKDLSELAPKIAELTSAKKDLETKVADDEKKIAELNATVDTLNAHSKELTDENSKQRTVLNKYEHGTMEKGIHGRVLAVNSGWGFCVTSIGDKQGAAANRMLIVVRGGQAIGKVKITNVETNQSIADIQPGTFVRGAMVQPGDEVIYTAEDKVNTEENNAPAPSSLVPAPLPQH